MSIPARLALFALAVASAFGIGAALGVVVPDLAPSQHVDQQTEHPAMP